MQRPNVIWIFGDQHRAQATGYSCDPNVHTPNIDRLATEGLCFDRAIAGTPLCTPFRGSLLTGRYPHHAAPGHEFPLPEGQQTIAAPFQKAGYHTSYFGKWHLDGFHETSHQRAAMHTVPPGRRGGFDHWVGYENNKSYWDTWVHGGEGDSAFHQRLPGFETDELTTMFIDHLHDLATKSQPFFAVLSVMPPHDPYVAPAEWMQRHTPGRIQLRPNVPAVDHVTRRARRDLAGYYAMIENLDWNLGRICDVLSELNLAHQTHIIFFSDHGDLHGSHGQFRKTAPWEEAIRIPFIIGGHIPFYQHTTGNVDVLINHVDIAPTTLGLCGIDIPEWMEGTDYSGYRIATREKPSEPDSAYLQLVVPTEHWDSVDQPWRGIVTHDGWKYVVMAGIPWLMFNLSDDPYEQVNLAHNSHYLSERQRLHQLLLDWIAKTDDTFDLRD